MIQSVSTHSQAMFIKPITNSFMLAHGLVIRSIRAEATYPAHISITGVKSTSLTLVTLVQ